MFPPRFLKPFTPEHGSKPALAWAGMTTIGIVPHPKSLTTRPPDRYLATTAPTLVTQSRLPKKSKRTGTLAVDGDVVVYLEASAKWPTRDVNQVDAGKARIASADLF